MSRVKGNAVDRDAHGRVKPGGKLALKHGVYARFTAEEKAERAEYERLLTDDLGGNPSVMERSLIRRASWLELRLRRNERAGEDGKGEIASEHVLSWINSQRLLLCALGLERVVKPGESLAEFLERGGDEETAG